MQGYDSMNEKTRRGFTLIELMIVIAIILMIAAIAIPQLMSSKKSANAAAAVAALQEYAAQQKNFVKNGADAHPENSAVPGGYAANFRNLYYGNPVRDGVAETSELLKMIPKDMADAFVANPENTNASPLAPAVASAPYHGYLFREPREMNPEKPSDFADDFALVAYPADSSTTGGRAFWIGLDEDDAVVMYYQDLPAGKTAENDSDMDTPSSGSFTGWSGM